MASPLARFMRFARRCPERLESLPDLSRLDLAGGSERLPVRLPAFEAVRERGVEQHEGTGAQA